MSLSDLILHPVTRHQLDGYLTKPGHALMLIGPEGVGLGTIARTVAHQLAGADTIYLAPSTHKQQKTAIINADDIADLGKVVRDRRNHRLAVIIDGADQTANGVFERMLKLIEEPAPNIYYIFTAHDLAAIPATIMSRTGLIRAMLPSAADCQPLYQGVNPRLATQIKFIADRRPAMIKRWLISSDDFADQAARMKLAKQFVGASRDGRLVVVENIGDRQDAADLCRCIYRLMIILAEYGQDIDSVAMARRFELLATTVERIQGNGNLRLQLINLAVNY